VHALVRNTVWLVAPSTPQENPVVGVQACVVAGAAPAQYVFAAVVPSLRRHVTLRDCVELNASATQLALRVCVTLPQPEVGDQPE